MHWVEVSREHGILTEGKRERERERGIACRHTIVSGEKNFPRRTRVMVVVYPADREEREGEGTEREGVSFKLEIASSAAMMGRKLGAKLNAAKYGG